MRGYRRNLNQRCQIGIRITQLDKYKSPTQNHYARWEMNEARIVLKLLRWSAPKYRYILPRSFQNIPQDIDSTSHQNVAPPDDLFIVDSGALHPHTEEVKTSWK